MLLALSAAVLVQLPALAQRPSVERANTVVVGGEVFEGPTDALDDSVPLPAEREIQAGQDGDVVTAQASGDPYFLGFAAGPYYPPADEHVDPLLAAQLQSSYADGRALQETYAFVMFAKRITSARLDALRDAGCRVLEFHPHYTMKVALAPRAVDAVASLDFVRWIGVPRSWQKVHPMMADAVAHLAPGETLDAYIDVYESDLCDASTSRAAATVEYGGPDGIVHTVDGPNVGPRAWMSNGWQQRALQSLGVDVLEYVDSIRAFHVRLAPASIEQLVALDFVQFVEPEPQKSLGHDESMPMVMMDRTRASYDGSTNSAAVAGQADSGIYYAHNGITGYYWWATNFTSEASTSDDCEHGTHVAGTIHGSGAVDPSLKGGANGLGWGPDGRYFNTKIFSGAGCSYASGTSMSSILGAMDSSVNDGSGNITPRAMAINHSWGSGPTAGGFFGSEADCRTIDNNVFNSTQLQCFIAHNNGPAASTVNEEGSSKNNFTVGGVIDYQNGALYPGEMYNASGRGPTGDNRWKPNIVAPAEWITSAHANSASGYVTYHGTSMAAPHVTALASELCDHFAFLRHNPSTLGALIMATATTKNDLALTSPSSDPANHLNNYGAGRIEAYKAHAFTGDVYIYGWTTGATYNFADITVGAGATRIVVCMWYHEAASSSGASSALVNDFDLYIDSAAGGIAAAGNSGEYVAQQSSINNVELRCVNSPVAGTWRLKLWPQSVVSTCRIGLAAAVYYDDTTPDPTVSVTSNDYYVQPGDSVQISASYHNPEFVASAVYLDSTSTGDVLTGSTTTLKDGAVTDLLGNQQSGRDVLIGDVAPNDTRTAKWTTHWNSEGAKTFSVTGRSDNAIDESDSVTIYVDGTAPASATNLHSTTHTPNVWTNDTSITYAWTAATDNLSGIDGYGIFTSSNTGLPGQTKDIEQVTSYSEALTQGTWYFNLRSVDNSGNWNASYVSTGPYKIDTTNPGTASGLSSPTHTVNVQSCSTNVTVNWTAATDSGGSGLTGYIGVWNTSASTNPIGASNIAAGATSYATDIGSSASARYFHLRALDAAGNYGTTVHFGPIYANSASVVIYCTGKTNSAGCVPAIGTNGVQPSKSNGTFTVTCSNALNNKNGLLFFGFTSTATPFQGGIKCVASPTYRGPNSNSGGNPGGNDCSGAYAQQFSTSFMSFYSLDPGDTVYAQWWTRDPGVASTTGLSNAIQFTVCQ